MLRKPGPKRGVIHCQTIVVVKVPAAIGLSRAARTEHGLTIDFRQHGQVERLEGSSGRGWNVLPVGDCCRRVVFCAAKISVGGVVLELKSKEGKREFIEPNRARLVGATPNERTDCAACFGQ